eukprot:XP_003975852.1 PREDICTED: regulator of G-protein signaling 21-like [Takifugu rubripes]
MSPPGTLWVFGKKDALGSSLWYRSTDPELSRSEMMPESLLQGGCCSFSPAPLDTQDTKRMCQAWKSRMHQFVQSPISWRRTCRKESKHGFLGESLDTLLSHKCGLALFRDFLKSEFCEENLDFWLACQEFRSVDSPEELRRRATSIYEEFVRANAKKQVNLDFDTRESISQNLQQPTPSCFAAAQRKIYGLMENSSFPRFVQSEQYKVLVQVRAGLAGFGRKQKGL